MYRWLIARAVLLRAALNFAVPRFCTLGIAATRGRRDLRVVRIYSIARGSRERPLTFGARDTTFYLPRAARRVLDAFDLHFAIARGFAGDYNAQGVNSPGNSPARARCRRFEYVCATRFLSLPIARERAERYLRVDSAIGSTSA